MRRVVDDEQLRKEIIFRVYYDHGYRGREGTYSNIANRYYWPGMYNEVRKYVQHYRQC